MWPVDLERRQPERVAQAELRVGDHRERHVVPLGELDLVVERLRERPAMRDAPSAASSAAWSRKPHDCGVQPRAPGNVVPAGERQLAGVPVRG